VIVAERWRCTDDGGFLLVVMKFAMRSLLRFGENMRGLLWEVFLLEYVVCCDFWKVGNSKREEGEGREKLNRKGVSQGKLEQQTM